MPIPAGPALDGLVSLDDLKAEIGSTPVSDATLQAYLDTAREQIEYEIGPVVGDSVTETLIVGADGTLFLSTAPVAEVTAMSQAGTALAPTYVVRAAAGLVKCLPPRATVTVTYSTGRADVPESVRRAQVIIVKQLMDRDAGSVPTDYRSTDEPVMTAYTGFAIPEAAKQLLAPYRLGPVVA